MKEGENLKDFEDFKAAFRIVNECGHLDHLTGGPSSGCDLSAQPLFGRLINTLLNTNDVTQRTIYRDCMGN